MRALLILLLCPVLGWTGDLSGIVKYGAGDPSQYDLGSSGTLSLVRKDDDQLRWHLAWNSKANGEQSITSGEGFGPDEASAYFWDEAGRTLWYYTPRVVVKLTMVSDTSSKSLHRSAKNYQQYTDLPPAFRADIEKIRGQAETPKS